MMDYNDLEGRDRNVSRLYKMFSWRKEENCKELGQGTPAEIRTYQIKVYIFTAAPACEIDRLTTTFNQDFNNRPEYHVSPALKCSDWCLIS
jgi:hypothetical protein